MDRLWHKVDRAAPHESTPLSSYLVAIAGSVGATLASLACTRLFGTELPFLFAIAAVALTALIGGFLPAMVAIALSMGAAIEFSPLSPRVTGANIFAIVVFSLSLAVAGEIILRLRRRSDGYAWQLAQREAYLQSIFETLPAAMLVLDDAGKILACNKVAASLFGYARHDLNGTSLDQILSLPGNASSFDRLATAMARYRLNGELVTGLKKDGSRLDVAVGLAEIAVGNGQFQTLYVRDETDAKQAAIEHAALQAEVQQLGRATALGQLGSAIAHELNQPLASAANYAGAARRLLASGTTDSRVDEAISESLTQVFRASAVLKRLRKFVQPEERDARWMDVHQIMAEAVQLVRLPVRHAGASLRVEIDPDVAYLLADRVQIQQVLLNLIVNATEAVCDQPNRELVISVTRDEPGYATIAVRDHGTGVSPAIRDALFKPFSSSKHNGLGVGLAISRSIVAAHGGRLWCDDSVEDGARFCFALPHRRESELDHAA